MEPGAQQQETYFASPLRSTDDELIAEIAHVNSFPVMTGLLDAIGGLLAILNEHRQLVALNDPLLKELGVEDSQAALGLRLGEALLCAYADEGPSGCGTSMLCSSCGAAMAIVSSLEGDEPVERVCALKAIRAGEEVDIALNVKSCPVRIDGKRFLLIFLQDITEYQQKAALERTFFHDINNMLSMLEWSSELLVQKEPSRFAEIIKNVSSRLLKEVEMQRCLSAEKDCSYQPQRENASVEQVFSELQGLFANHPAANIMRLNFVSGADSQFNTDMSIIMRVLTNMLINACEATVENGEVKIWSVREADQVAFYVWNEQPIPEQHQKRIFQRNFSSKEGAGRGLGTFSMRYFGEQILGGKVSFKSSSEAGTTFRFAVPI